ncbi:hypothetical protein H2204_010304 [Knufia peltigerae]|uniref:PRISE-like Rossmann-fold domain-containing protein n=1 Tax=Knufia peltigerae TaxID=1002370 RepID=A0AA39CU92_9EURO|nr:hypothetical protein H2204_010304 [Knufia peltigerae]
MASGLDILAGDQSALEASLAEKVDGIGNVTHVYFFAYIADADPDREVSINASLLQRAIVAVDKLSKSLKFVVVPTGTKAYGIHLLDRFPFKDRLPLVETLPRIPEPDASRMFYYKLIDMMRALSKDRPWSFVDVIPDNIIGFVPNNNMYCMAQSLGLYLSLYHEIEGHGAQVVFPGTMESWKAKINDSSQDIVARFSIYASLHPETAAGESVNVADNTTPTSWSQKWPVICEYFGLRGVAPEKGSGPDPEKYLTTNMDRWVEMEKKYGLQTGRVTQATNFVGFPHFIMVLFNFDRHLDLDKMHRIWGSEKEEWDVKTSWWTALDRFKKAKIIPDFS